VTRSLFVNLVLYFRDILFVERNRVFGLTGHFWSELENDFILLLSTNILSMTVGRYSEFFVTFGVRNRLYIAIFFLVFLEIISICVTKN